MGRRCQNELLSCILDKTREILKLDLQAFREFVNLVNCKS